MTKKEILTQVFIFDLLIHIVVTKLFITFPFFLVRDIFNCIYYFIEACAVAFCLIKFRLKVCLSKGEEIGHHLYKLTLCQGKTFSLFH